MIYDDDYLPHAEPEALAQSITNGTVAALVGQLRSLLPEDRHHTIAAFVTGAVIGECQKQRREAAARRVVLELTPNTIH